MNPNPLSTNSAPMAFKDAAIVAAVLTIFLLATAFFPGHSYDALRADPARWIYELLTSALTYWITTFAAQTGLMAYASRVQSGDGEGGK